MQLYPANSPTVSGGSCGCTGKGKLFGGKKRASLRRSRHHKKRQSRRKRFFTRRQHTGGVGGAEDARNVIPLNTLQDDPIHASVSARLEGAGGLNGGNRRRRRHQHRRKTARRSKRGGGIMDYLQDPLLGKNPDPITGFGSSAGLSNSFQLLAGNKYTASGMGETDPAKTLGTGVSPKI